MKNSLAATALACAIGSSAMAADLGPCEDENLGPNADCGTISVLEDRGKPEGRTIDLNVIVLRGDEAAGRSPVFVLAGGPGQAASDMAGLVLGVWPPVRETRDVVLVDQRGTGGSNRLDCPVDAAGDPASVFGKLWDREAFRVCLEAISQHADPRLYGSLEVVADLEQVRRELGYDKAVLWGASGGTRTALVWMKEYPEAVEAVLIDGVTPTWFRSPTAFAPGAQASLDHVFEDCAAQESCGAAYPNLRQQFDRLMALFADGPVETSIRNQDDVEVPIEMHRGDFAYAVRGMLYNSRGTTVLPRIIHEAATGGDVSEFAQRYWERQVGVRPIVAMGVHFGVICTEDMAFIDDEVAAEQSRGTFLGDYLLRQYGAVCADWPRGELPDDYLEPVTEEIPVLLVSGYYDPSTPAYFADQVAEHLPNSRHILVRNEGHGAEFGCAREAAIRFLISGSLEGLGPVCEDAGPIEFEVP
jgi:pimeloyl-ACP methyl ester carboxylesterase